MHWSLSILNEEPINEDNEFKTLDGKRNYDIFRRLMSDQNKVRSFNTPRRTEYIQFFWIK